MDNEQNKEQNTKTAVLPKRKVIQRKKLSNFTKEKVWEKAQFVTRKLLISNFTQIIGLPEQDLAFRFGISQNPCFKDISYLDQLSGSRAVKLIYWPDREDVQRYYPQCFQKYISIIGTINCTEVTLENPRVAKTQDKAIQAINEEIHGRKLLA